MFCPFTIPLLGTASLLVAVQRYQIHCNVFWYLFDIIKGEYYSIFALRHSGSSNTRRKYFTRLGKLLIVFDGREFEDYFPLFSGLFCKQIYRNHFFQERLRTIQNEKAPPPPKITRGCGLEGRKRGKDEMKKRDPHTPGDHNKKAKGGRGRAILLREHHPCSSFLRQRTMAR